MKKPLQPTIPKLKKDKKLLPKPPFKTSRKNCRREILGWLEDCRDRHRGCSIRRCDRNHVWPIAQGGSRRDRVVLVTAVFVSAMKIMLR